MKTKIAIATQYEDQEVVGIDPEAADMGNPDGAIYGNVHRVEAEDADGRRWFHNRTFADEDAAWRMSCKVNRKGEIDLDFWTRTFDRYGSPAWEAGERDRQMAHDMGPLAGTVRDV